MSIHIKLNYFCPYCGQKHGRTSRPLMPGENLGDQVRGATKICIMCSDFYHKSKDYFNEKHKRSVFNKIVNTILLRAKKAYWDNMEAAVFEWVYKGGLPKKHNAWLLVEILFRATDDLINNQVFKPPIKCKYILW